MAIDNLSLEIETRAINVGYINAIIDFCEEKEIYDYEDVLDQLHPILRDKVKQEYIDKNFIPALKIKNPLERFFYD